MRRETTNLFGCSAETTRDWKIAMGLDWIPGMAGCSSLITGTSPLIRMGAETTCPEGAMEKCCRAPADMSHPRFPFIPSTLAALLRHSAVLKEQKPNLN